MWEMVNIREMRVGNSASHAKVAFFKTQEKSECRWGHGGRETLHTAPEMRALLAHCSPVHKAKAQNSRCHKPVNKYRRCVGPHKISRPLEESLHTRKSKNDQSGISQTSKCKYCITSLKHEARCDQGLHSVGGGWEGRVSYGDLGDHS